jgi:hypothetical protein
MLGFAVIYQYGMATFEDRPKTFLESLHLVVETFTTTGFGSDAGWSSPAMNLFVIVMGLTGVVLIFLALPVMVFPLFENAFQTTVPTEVAASRADHVIICTYSPRAGALIPELESEDVISLDTQVEVVRTQAPMLERRTLEEALARSRTGCTVVAIERDGELDTDVGPETQIEPGDRLVIAGTDQGTNRYRKLMT